MKIKVVRVLPSLVVALALTPATPMAESSSSSSALTSRIDYEYVANGEMDDEGRVLVWEGTIEGDITGTMKWWFGPSPAPYVGYQGGGVGYYEARWEIWDDAELLLAGESAGKTVIPDGADGMWDGHGVVTEASMELNTLKGRKVYETGPVIWDPFPFSGTGIFLIY